MRENITRKAGTFMVGLALLLMVGCESSSKGDTLTGSWGDEAEEVLTFSTDGSFTASDWDVGATGTWTASDGVLTITQTNGSESGSQVYTYVIINNTLLLTRNGVLAGPYPKI